MRVIELKEQMAELQHELLAEYDALLEPAKAFAVASGITHFSRVNTISDIAVVCDYLEVVGVSRGVEDHYLYIPLSFFDDINKGLEEALLAREELHNEDF